MEISLQHHHDYAVVPFTGMLDWPSCIDLVACVDTAIGIYFYRTVEIAVTSPGGDAHALAFLISALARWRDQGVRVRTRVSALARSAAAILVALGEERVADPGSSLHFHHPHARISDEELTARQGSTLVSDLQRIDDDLLRHLVDRALTDPTSRSSKGRHGAESSDLHVLQQLWPATGQGDQAPPRRVRVLASAIGKAIDKAIREGDRPTLTRIYRRLLDTDRSISAGLAFTLGLVDRIGQDESDAPRGTPWVQIPEWHSLFPPTGAVPREILTRHALILGETGAGKTASAILPIVSAVATAPPDRVAATLIIDPKQEIGPVLQRLAPERLRHLATGEVALDLMAGPRWRLDEDLAAGRWLSAATRILCRVASFVPQNPARVLLRHAPGSYDEFFDREGAALALVVLSFVLMVTSPRSLRAADWLGDDQEGIDLVEQLRAKASGLAGERGPNAVALAAWFVDGPALSFNEGFEGGWLFTRIAKSALPRWEESEAQDVLHRIIDYWDAISRIRAQYAGVRATARIICADFAAPSIARTLYFGCEPGYVSVEGTVATVDFSRLVAPDGGGALILFQPARDELDALVARALKASFFEAVLSDPDRLRGSSDLPVVTYIADEAHRFVTSDVVHGEQSFLDTCRAFGGCCVLACQSLSSLEHALTQSGGNSTQHEAAVSILWTNTGSKFLFRTTDPTTASRLHELCPTRPGMPPVSRVRPLATLAPGESYALLADGRFERRQLGQFQFQELSLEISRSRQARER